MKPAYPLRVAKLHPVRSLKFFLKRLNSRRLLLLECKALVQEALKEEEGPLSHF
jgi:hypothetical protein